METYIMKLYKGTGNPEEKQKQKNKIAQYK